MPTDSVVDRAVPRAPTSGDRAVAAEIKVLWMIRCQSAVGDRGISRGSSPDASMSQ